ncbi:unnamed protein product [Cuscuta epithymum]|uniref:DUF3741 domain-containing protein n=1 Tax=Cuscuta epithymum TaxID=186058 RepID=A0AAV0C6G8_9ASTE|nr:unnamed protein product [Cuscuta epithymum]
MWETMGAKSDLAQKLLQDLRLRKERLSSSQNSSQSQSRGKYANAGQSHRGSQTSSAQIVPYSGAQRVQSSGKKDLSMGITVSIEKRDSFAKLNSSCNNNAVYGVVHQFGQRSFDFMGKMESSQYVTLSNVQVSEISKGIQKINKILKTSYSNGGHVNFDTYSFEVVGKELLKGAMDLESSLRMLVDLQEASSKHIITSQRKNRQITLLDEEDETNNVKTAVQKHQDLPKFSFDNKPSRKSYTKKETTGSAQKLLALTYFKDASANLERETLSTHGTEKGRISNVIAKLMGLDEFPRNKVLKASRHSASKKNDKPPHHNSDQKAAVNSSPELTKHRRNNNIHHRDNKIAENEAITVKRKLEIHKPTPSHMEGRLPQTVRNNNSTNLKSVPKREGPLLNRAKHAKHRAEEKPIKEIAIKKKESRIQTHIKDTLKNTLKQQSPILKVKKQVKCHVDSTSGVKGKLSEEHPIELKEENTSEFDKEEAVQEIVHCESKVLALHVHTEDKDAMELHRSSHQDAGQNPDISYQKNLQNHQEGDQELFQDQVTKTVPIIISENPPAKSETCSSNPKQQKEPLTEPEKNLKESLIKSHLFLSTAEALLNLNLPVSVFYANDHINEGAERLLTVDCAYEVMKRKARRQELSAYPHARKPITGFIKIRSLDDLIKQLCKDFEKLTSFDRSGSEEDCESTQYFDPMLAKDMENTEPDINCMWDLGWDGGAMFAFLEKGEVAKDVEKHLMKGLIEEVTADLF